MQTIGEITETSRFQLLSFGSNKEKLKHICQYCGREVLPTYVEGWPDGIGRWCPVACKCEVKKLEEQGEKAERDIRLKAMERKFNLQLGDKLRNASFVNWERSEDTDPALKEACELVKNWRVRHEKKEGLLFFGSPGNGKSHLSIAISKKLIEQGVLVAYLNLANFISRILRKKKDESESDLLDAVVKAECVVLDDIASGSWGQVQIGKFEDMITQLEYHNILLVANTNIDPENFEQILGQRSADRLYGMCRIVENKGLSYRKKMAARRVEETKKEVTAP